MADFDRFRPASELASVGDALSEYMTVARFTNRDAIKRAYYVAALDNIGRRNPEPDVNTYLGPKAVDDGGSSLVASGNVFRKIAFDEEYTFRTFAVFFSPNVTDTSWRGVVRDSGGILLAATPYEVVSGSGNVRREFVLDEDLTIVANKVIYVGVESDIASNESVVFENDYPSIVPGSAQPGSFTYKYLPLNDWSTGDVLVRDDNTRMLRIDPLEASTVLWDVDLVSGVQLHYMLTDMRIVVATNDGVRILDHVDGSEYWFVPIASSTTYALAVEQIDGATPTTAIYASGTNAIVDRFDGDGNSVWSSALIDFDTTTGGSVYSIAQDDDHLYVATSNEYIFQLDKLTGDINWKYAAGGSFGTDQTLLAEDGFLYFTHNGDGDGIYRVIKLDAATGIRASDQSLEVLEAWGRYSGESVRHLIATPDGRYLLILKHSFVMLTDLDDISPSTVAWDVLVDSYASHNWGRPALAPGGGSFFIGGMGNATYPESLYDTQWSTLDGSLLTTSNLARSTTVQAFSSTETVASTVWGLLSETQLPVTVERFVEFDPLADDGQLRSHRYWPSFVDLPDIVTPLRGLVPAWDRTRGLPYQMDVQIQDLAKDAAIDAWISLRQAVGNAFIAQTGVRIRVALQPADIIERITQDTYETFTGIVEPYKTQVCKTQWNFDSTPLTSSIFLIDGIYGISYFGGSTSLGYSSYFDLEDDANNESGEIEAIIYIGSNASVSPLFNFRRKGIGSGFSIQLGTVAGTANFKLIRHTSTSATDTLVSVDGLTASAHTGYGSGWYRVRVIWNGDRVLGFVNDRVLIDYSDSQLLVIGNEVGYHDNYSSSLSTLHEMIVRGAAPGEPNAADLVELDHLAVFHDPLSLLES